MKIVITGGKGMLGRTLQKELAEHEIVVADLPDWDITDDEGFLRKLMAAAPDVVIHCAAMTNVDACEADSDLAFKLNEEGSRNVALACSACGARPFAISTDYVFSGEPPREPWAWSGTDMPRQWRDSAATGLRIAWLCGAGGPSFVHTLAELGAEAGAPLRVVNDQRGNPTSAKAVADVIRFLLTRPDVSGIVHATCEDPCTWYDLACEVKRLMGDRFPRAVEPCTTEEFPRPAPRPHNSALKKSVLNVLGYRTPNWKKALADFVSAEFAR